MDRIITFKSKPLSLAGRAVKEGSRAPQFFAVDANLKEIRLSDYDGSIKLITSFPSLDTPVCEMQVKEFNRQASQMSGGVVIIGISQDLPFAQKRFCNSNNIDKMITLSDYRTNSFGINYGLLIKGLHLLARAVIIIDKANTIRYVQVAKELTNALNYEAALNALKEVIQNPSSYTPEELPSHCTPCQAGLPPLSKNSLEHLLSGIKGWELIEDKKIKKEFRFKDLIDAKYFVDLISIVAEEQGHHPNINLIYNKVIITLTTHSIGGLSNNDFLMAHIIDELGTQKEEEDAGI